MPRRILEGEVVSDRADKTVTVLVERKFMHPVYKKYVRRNDRYAAHDEYNQFKAGDRVEIIECRPFSKRKRWMVVTDGKPGVYKPREKRVIEDQARPDRPDSKKKKEAVQEAAAAAPAQAAEKKPAKKTAKKDA